MNEDVIKVQLSCGVDYYKGDKGDKPIKGVDYFTQEDIDDIVEQIETGGIDLDGYATKEYVDNAVSGVVVSETDPTVPAWAKQANKPSYTASEVGALPADTQLFSGNYNDLRNKPAIPTVPANVSAFNNDAGYLTEHQSLSGYATKAYVDEAIADIPAGGIAVETDPTVPSWAKQASKPTYTAQEVGALPADTELFSGDYEDLSNKPTLAPTPIVIQATIAGQPTPNSDGGYTLPLTITSNNMAEAYAQYQTHPSTVGMAVDLSAMGISTKMYMDCESFYRGGDGNGGYAYSTYGEFNDSSFSQSFGFEFQNINVRLSTKANDSYGTVIGVATANQLASKANSADLATVATSGDYNDLTNKPTIPTAYTLPTATTSTLGGVKVDGSTITIDGNGVISSSGGSSYTFTNGLTESNGTVSWDLNGRIKAGTGNRSVIVGNQSNTANGNYSFAEGSMTNASGLMSHAEGNYTQASGQLQHVEGKNNIEDSHSILQNIAGNGSSSARSTMFARDWNGNEYLSGNLFVGCNDFTTTANGLTTANAGGSRVATMSDLTTDNIPYYYIEGEDPETGDPIRSETADTLTETLDGINNLWTQGFDVSKLDENQKFEKYTAGYYATNINLQQVDEFDPETGDALGIREMNISASGIDFSNDSGGHTHTLGINENGDMAIDGDKILTTADNISGGSSYTAGNGINIDSNGVISAKPSYLGHYGINGLWSFWREKVNPTGGYMEDATVSSAEQAVEFLLKGLVINQNSNLTIDIRDIIDTHPESGTYTVIVFSLQTKKITERKNIGSSDNYQYTLSRFNQYVKLDNYTLLELTNSTTSTVNPSGLLPYFIIHKSPNYTTYNVADNLDEVMETVNTRIPTAPTTDGDYVLKVSVSSGTPTYSWVAE